MPIGPALPPHLALLSNRASSSRSGSSSPDQGPSPPSTSRASALADADFAPASAREDDDDDDDDDFGPPLPPHLAAARKVAGPASGPARPALYTSPSPPRLAAPLPAPEDEDDDSDSEEIGPVFTGETVERSAVEEFKEREARMMRQKEEEAQPKKPQRDEWMLVPPSSGFLGSTDPLRKRPTTFSRTNKDVEVDTSAWTETPQEKAQRLADEVAGVKRKKGSAGGSGGRGAIVNGQDDVERARKRQRDEEIRREIDRHNKETRGGSLLNKHAEKKSKGEEEPKAIWDHARDMGITGRLMTDKERSDKIREAATLNDRFGHSKRGAFDM